MPLSLAIGPNGEVALGGAFQGTIELPGTTFTSAGSYDGLVARFDAEGEPLSAFRFGNNSNQYVHDVAYTADGTLIALSYYGTAGTSFPVGDQNVTEAGSGDFMLIRFGEDGEPESVRSYGAKGTDIAVDSTGNLIVTGRFDGAVTLHGDEDTQLGNTTSMAVVGLTPELTLRFARLFDHQDDTGPGLLGWTPPALDVDAEDNVFVAGTFAGTLWAEGSSYSSAGGRAVSAGPQLNFVAGAFEGTLLGAPQAIESTDLYDVFVIGLEP